MNRFFYILLLVPTLFACSGKPEEGIEPHSVEELSGLRIATEAGSIYDMELSAREDVSLQLYNASSDVLQSVVNGMADVAVHDEVVFNSEIRKEYGLKIAFMGEQSYPTAFLFRQEDTLLAATCSAVQRRMVVDGTMQNLKDFWLTDRYSEAKSFTHIEYDADVDAEPLRIATSSTIAPISFEVDHEWYGIEIDILRELGKELHRPLEISHYDAVSSFMAVKSGRADILCGCLFITPERQEEYLFCEPYHYYRPAYFVLDPKKKDDSSDETLLQWFKKSIHRNLIVENRWKYITDGLLETIKISLLAILLGSILGIGLYSMGKSRRGWVRSIAKVYNGFMAGIPDLVLLLILFYVVFANSLVPSDIIAVISFAMFFASGASEIYKTSMDSVPRGNVEAGLALGFTRVQTFFNIVLPQAVKCGLPLFTSECISILKGTAIVGYIAIHDLTKAGDLIRSRTFDAVIPLLIVTVFYFLLAWLIGVLLKLAVPKKKVL